MIKKLRYLKYYAKVLLNNWRINKDSYAQHGEDKLIEHLLPKGVFSFIDIGANDGVLFSNSYKFAKNGAQGLCVEPSPSAFRKLKLNQLPNKGVSCINVAISNTNGKVMLQEDGYESTLSRVVKKRTQNSIEIPCYTMKDILSKFPKFSKVDIVSIDVEGHEFEVLDGMPITGFYTKLLIIESDKSQIEELKKLKFFKHYNPIISNGINTFFTHQKENFRIPNQLPEGFIFL
jgi:FkbM family methyltransferase